MHSIFRNIFTFSEVLAEVLVLSPFSGAVAVIVAAVAVCRCLSILRATVFNLTASLPLSRSGSTLRIRRVLNALKSQANKLLLLLLPLLLRLLLLLLLLPVNCSCCHCCCLCNENFYNAICRLLKNSSQPAPWNMQSSSFILIKRLCALVWVM